MVLQFENGNSLLQKFTCLKALKDDLITPWKDALVAKPLAQNVGGAPFEKRVRDLWKPNGEMEIIDLGFGHFLIKFDNDADRDKVLLEGPWTVQGHYLIVRRWNPKF